MIRMRYIMKSLNELESKCYVEFLEINSVRDCAAGSDLVILQALDGDWKPSTVRNRISRSDMNVRVLE
jgi:hypothetical protein